MRKLKLALETLQVESFNTAAAAEARGTVRGAEGTFNADCDTNNNWCTYQTYELQSCGGTCNCPGATDTCPGPTERDTCFYASCDGYTC
jgi:hypothetical protein